jgi:hypothetical protein
MLLLPIVLCALCWPILPQERKSWVIFPLLGLLAGASASNFAAIGEGAIAASYLWPLLFLFLFRVEHLIFQIVFLLLCIPALLLHEAAFPFMLVFLFACVGKYLAANIRAEGIFFGHLRHYVPYPVHSLIAAPIGASWQPFDSSNLDKLPRIRGVDYTVYATP